MLNKEDRDGEVEKVSSANFDRTYASKCNSQRTPEMMYF